MSQPIPAASTSDIEAQRKRTIRYLVCMTAVAFLLRLAILFAFHTYEFVPSRNHYSFGFETGSIAASIATGRGFTSPFGVPSGPTSWIAPIYPAIVAGFFKLFGLFTEGSAIAVLVFNSLCSAVTAPVIFRIAKRIFDARSGYIAGWIWALVPFFACWPVTWVWETALSALLCAVVFSFTIELETTDWRPWAGLGAFWSVIALTSPSLLGFLPASFLYPAWKVRSRLSLALSRLVVASVFFLVGISPWLARNEAVFHHPVFLRGNFFFEMSLSNFHNSTGEAWSGLHPARNQRVLDRYLNLGEVAFVSEAKQRVFEFIKANPIEFAELTATRVAHFWDGGELNYEPLDQPMRPWMVFLTSVLAFGGLWLAYRRNREWAPFGWLLLLFPLPYYLTYTNPRYRHPIEPMMVALTGYLISECWAFMKSRTSTAAKS